MSSGISIQKRDLEVLQSLFESRILTAKHIAAFHFDGSAEAAKKRLQKLKAEGFLLERRRKPYEPSLLSISEGGYKVLRGEGSLADYPQLSWNQLKRRNKVSELTLRHELEILDVKAAFFNSLRDSKHYFVKKFTTWPALAEFTARTSSPIGYMRESVVKPDGFIVIGERAEDGEYEHTFFLELDRSTETLETVCRKCVCYVQYYRGGGFALRNGTTRADFKEFPFRVLLVCKSEERIKHLAARLLSAKPPILSQVCLATKEDVLSDPLDAKWIHPARKADLTPGILLVQDGW